MRPTCPPPTKQYVAAQRAEHTKPDAGCPDPNAVLREQAPFWLLQASIAYSVPDNCDNCEAFKMKPMEGEEYNTVSFKETLTKLQQEMQPSDIDDRKYLAMGSFYRDRDNSAKKPALEGRYFLTAVGSANWTIAPSKLVFAPSGSFILSFAGTEGLNYEVVEDFDWRPVEAPCDFYPDEYAGPKVWTYKSMLKVCNTAAST